MSQRSRASRRSSGGSIRVRQGCARRSISSRRDGISSSTAQASSRQWVRISRSSSSMSLSPDWSKGPRRESAPRLPEREVRAEGHGSISCRSVPTFDLLADLPLEVEGYTLEGLKAEVSSGFERLSTIVHLAGGGTEGIGEDVVYD